MRASTIDRLVGLPYDRSAPPDPPAARQTTLPRGTPPMLTDFLLPIAGAAAALVAVVATVASASVAVYAVYIATMRAVRRIDAWGVR